jgi:Lhr-like helicase
MFINKETYKYLGIWLDHSTAYLVVYNDKIDTQIIELEVAHTNKMEVSHYSENGKHNKAQKLQEVYYQKISAEILKYESVLLFGPTDAKNELYNFFMKYNRPSNIKFTLLDAERMNKKEKIAFVKNHFKTIK